MQEKRDLDNDCSGELGLAYCMDTFGWDYSCFDVHGYATCLQDDFGHINYNLYEYIESDDEDCSGGQGTGYCMDMFGWDYSCFDVNGDATCLQDDTGHTNYNLYEYIESDDKDCSGGQGTGYCMEVFGYDYSCFDVYGAATCLQDEEGYENYDFYDNSHYHYYVYWQH